MGELLGPLAAVTVIGVWFVVCELGTRGLPAVDPEVFRKAAHAGGAVLAACSVLWIDVRAYVVIGLAFAAAMLLLARFLPLRAMGERPSWGPVAYGLGTATAALIAPDPLRFMAALLILGLADTAAVVVGKRWPLYRFRTPGPAIAGGTGADTASPHPDTTDRTTGPSLIGKSVGGALGFWVVATMILGSASVISGQPPAVGWPLAAAVALLLAAVEAFTPGGWDNLTVPALTAAFAWLM